MSSAALFCGPHTYPKQHREHKLKRVSALQRKGLKLVQGYPLITLAAIQKDSRLRFSSSGDLFSVKGQVKSLVESPSAHGDLASAGTPGSPGADVMPAQGTPKS
eukprot:3525830-Amphidinium_carterae.2